MFVRNFTILSAAVVMLGACASKTDQGNVDVSTDGAVLGGADGVYVDSGPTPGTQADLVVNVGDRIFFDTDSTDLTAAARTVLENQAQWMSQYSHLNVVIEGHADERGTREYNLALGERRANSVRNYLVALGVDAARVSVISYGKERPAVPGSNDAAWSQNRRGVTKVQ